MNGTVFAITRFAVHDGSGIRTTLFLKGCPLKCPWCQNPEGIKQHISLWHSPSACIQCGICVETCPERALELDGRIHIDKKHCTGCGMCIEKCPAAAMAFDGWVISDHEAAELLLRDRPFFGDSGGVTLSGGEVMAQPEFARSVLKRCKDSGVNTAMETCLLAPRKEFEAMLPLVDQFLVDIKYWNARDHKQIGASNEQILDNYAYLVSSGADVLVRTPLIPGYTATEENIRAIARYVADTNPETKYELLNYNPLCRSKYSAMEKDYPVKNPALTDQEMDFFYGILEQEGIRNIIKKG